MDRTGESTGKERKVSKGQSDTQATRSKILIAQQLQSRHGKCFAANHAGESIKTPSPTDREDKQDKPDQTNSPGGHRRVSLPVYFSARSPATISPTANFPTANFPAANFPAAIFPAAILSAAMLPMSVPSRTIECAIVARRFFATTLRALLRHVHRFGSAPNLPAR